MKRKRHLAQTLGGKQKAAAIVATVVVGFGLGFGVAHLMAGSIAYWGVVSGPFLISLRVAVPATLIAGITGVASGYALAKGRFPGRNILETLGSLPIILPPTVIGFYLLEVLSPGTQVGGFLTRPGRPRTVYNVIGCIIVATVAAYPVLHAGGAGCHRRGRPLDRAGRADDGSTQLAGRAAGDAPARSTRHRRRAHDRSRPRPGRIRGHPDGRRRYQRQDAHDVAGHPRLVHHARKEHDDPDPGP